MLVSDVEPVKSPQMTAVVDGGPAIWSTVGLHRFERVEDLAVCDAGLDLRRDPLPVLVEGRLANGELGLVGWGATPPVKHYELPGQVVQRGARVVDRVPEEQTPVWVHRRKVVHPDDIVAR